MLKAFYPKPRSLWISCHERRFVIHTDKHKNLSRSNSSTTQGCDPPNKPSLLVPNLDLFHLGSRA